MALPGPISPSPQPGAPALGEEFAAGWAPDGPPWGVGVAVPPTGGRHAQEATVAGGLSGRLGVTGSAVVEQRLDFAGEVLHFAESPAHVAHYPEKKSEQRDEAGNEGDQ